MVCVEDGCEQPALSRGMCNRHYKAWRRAGKPDGRELATRVAKTCAEAECEEKAYARGFCSRHYKQLRRDGVVEPDPAPTLCAVESCGRRAVTRGWCHGHYLRWSRQGDVRAGVPLRRTVHDVCTVEGCERGATRALYCRSHYTRWKRYGDPLAGGPVRLVTGDGCISHGYWKRPIRQDERHLVPDGRTTELEHRLVMAAMLGRPLLPTERVHHLDGNRLNNDPSNLELWSTSQPSGQRVADKLAWARQILTTYEPEEARRLGWDR